MKFQLAKNGKNRREESSDDEIIEISRPYLEGSIVD